MAVVKDLTMRTQSSFYQYFATFCGSLAIICSGLHFGWTSPSAPKLENHPFIKFKNEDRSLLVRYLLIGDVLGALVSGNIVDRIGRKSAVILAMFPYLMSWLLIGFATSIETICVARFFAGISDGILFTVIPIYLAEISDPKIRGFISAATTVSLVLGLLIINILGLYLSISTVGFICAFLPISVFFLLLCIPESPYYYLLKKNLDKARKSLMKFGRYSEENLKMISDCIEKDSQRKGNVFDLIRINSNRKALIIAITLRTIQQCGGGSAFTFYTQEIFQKASNNNPLMNQLSTIIYFSVQLVACICSSFFVDKVGRKPLLICSCFGAACTLFYEGYYFYNLDAIANSSITDYSWISLSVLIIYICFYSCGLSIIPIMMISEIFPASVKGSAMCICDIYFAIIAESVSEMFNIMKQKYGFHVLFWIFALFCLFGIFFIYYFVPETKKKSLEEIQLKLKYKHSKNHGNVFLVVNCDNKANLDDNTIPQYNTHL